MVSLLPLLFLNYKNNQATSHIIKKTNCDSVETLFDGFWSLFAANPACCNVEFAFMFWCLVTDRINKAGIKVPILKEVNFGKMQLCRVEHFYNIFVLTFGVIAEYNSNLAQKWGQICCKSVQLVRVSSFRNDFVTKSIL